MKHSASKASKVWLLAGLCLWISACAPKPLVWQWSSPKASVNWISTGDANHDGHADLLVGLASAEGAALFLGGPQGLSKTPSWLFKGGDQAALTGFCVGFAGDMDGDGFTEIYVTAPRDKGVGSVFLFRTGSQGPEVEPWRILHGSEKGEGFGEQAAAPGDLNGDGYADLAIGDFSFGQHRGRLCVYYGSPKGPRALPDWTALGENPGDWFGYSLGQKADLDGDGFDDLLVGAKNCSGSCLRWLAQDPRYSLHRAYLEDPKSAAQGSSAQAGKLYVYWGSRQGLAKKAGLVKEGEVPHSLFAFKVLSLDGPPGDPKGRIVVSTPGWLGKRGKLELFTSDPKRRLTKIWETVAEKAGSEQGYQLGVLGDADGDGLAELVSGTRQGSLSIFRGTNTSFETLASWVLSSERTGWAWPGPLAGADFNGDGKTELIGCAYQSPAVKGELGRVVVYELGKPIRP